MSGPASRRGFLSGLATLPLIGGSVALIGSPSAVAEPLNQRLLDAYDEFLDGERRALKWERFFDKQHKHVLAAIRELHCSAAFREPNFRPFKIKDLQGETTSHVLMTRDGFMFLAMGFICPARA